jgi:hypothetical protein
MKLAQRLRLSDVAEEWIAQNLEISAALAGVCPSEFDGEQDVAVTANPGSLPLRGLRVLNS